VLGDPSKVKYVGTTAKVRFSVLQSGEIDVLIRDSTQTLSRNTDLGLATGAVNFFTGQAFMVKKALNVGHVKELNGATICVLTGTTLELNIADYGRANNIKINTLLFEKPEEAFAAAEAGRCDGYTDDGGSVAAARSAMKNPKDWVILPELISREFLGSLCRQGDERWSILVNWVHYAMLEAEVLGITQANVDQIKASRPIPRYAASSASRMTTASSSVSTTPGPTTSSRPSAITARTTINISARSSCRAAGTTSTTTVDCSTRCPGAKPA
jgi:general L-amino acid transport system substrate-binding protein